jgi:hypothetical protein
VTPPAIALVMNTNTGPEAISAMTYRSNCFVRASTTRFVALYRASPSPSPRARPAGDVCSSGSDSGATTVM